MKKKIHTYLVLIMGLILIGCTHLGVVFHVNDTKLSTSLSDEISTVSNFVLTESNDSKPSNLLFAELLDNETLEETEDEVSSNKKTFQSGSLFTAFFYAQQAEHKNHRIKKNGIYSDQQLVQPELPIYKKNQVFRL